MDAATPVLDRPKRWGSAFNEDMTEGDVRRLLTIAPFKDMNPESFPRSAPLPEVLRNDAGIRRYQKGEIVVREGDYGTSAFMVLSGRATVVLPPGLPAAVVGRREPSRRGIFRAVAQLWSNAREDEVARQQERQQFFRPPGAGAAGDVRVILQDVPRILDRHRTATLQPGDFFGEIAALSRIPRTASIFATDDGTELLEIRWQGLRDLMRYDKALRQHIDSIYREHALSTFLGEIPFLKYLSEEARQQVMAATQFETYGDYDWSGDYKKLVQSGATAAREQTIGREGDYPNDVVMIRSGFARLTHSHGAGHRTLNYLGAGGIYGFDEIAHNWRAPDRPVALQHSLRVIGYTHVLVIPAPIIERVVLPSLPGHRLPPLLDPEPATPALAPTRGEKPGAVDSELMEYLTENRFFNGTAAMVLDLERCTRCDDCVRACAATHDNNPRFLRHGPVHGHIMVANACMHCADPICMIGCPTGAIHRDAFGGEVVINPATCIGCTTCANNCPYTAIRMVEIRDEEGRILEASDSKPILKATKCDLCIDQYGGPACERACPHDALQRINLNTLAGLAGWLDR